MNSMARPNSLCSRASRLMICAWIDTSSADTGSSATMKFGLDRERPGDDDALALAAGEFVRVAVGVLGGEADALEDLDHGVALAAAAPEVVDRQRLGQRRADPHARVEARERVLEDDLHAPADRRAWPRGRAW